MIVGLLALVVIVGLMAVGVALTSARTRRSGPHGPHAAATSPAASARRIVVFLLLFVLVVIAASGVTGLLERLFDRTPVLAEQGTGALAQSLAFTLVGGPLSLLLWWSQWRHLDEPHERASDAWSLYVAATSTVALVAATAGLLNAVGAWIGEEPAAAPLAVGSTWGVVWGWHHWMSTHPSKSPTRLRDIAPVAGAAYGLVIGARGAVATLVAVTTAAVDAATGTVSVGPPWWRPALQGLVWAVGGTLLWWAYWTRAGARQLRTTLADLGVLGTGALAAPLVGLGGGIAALLAVLRLAFDRSESVRQLLDPLPVGLGLGAVGALVWAYHRRDLATRAEGTREAARLITSGVALSAAATGIGIVVNSALDAITPTLVGGGDRALLLGGLSALLVGGPAWWLAWQPRVAPPTRAPTAAARRIYLVVVFGLAGVVGLITLLVIGIRVFEFTLGDGSAEHLIDRIRAPLGLFLATALVAGYHFGVWRHDRAITANAAPARRIKLVVLVTGSDPQPLADAIRDTTGAAVTVWRRADAAEVSPEPAALVAALATALDGLVAERVLVVCGSAGQVEVVPLAP